MDVSQATVNPQPLYPDVWYELYGGTKPEGAVNMVIGTTEAPPTTTPAADHPRAGADQSSSNYHNYPAASDNNYNHNNTPT